MKHVFVRLAALLLVLLTALGAYAETESGAAKTAEERAQEMLSSMTLREKVGQMFLIRADALDFTQPYTQVNDAWAEGRTELTEDMKRALAEYPCGGVAFSSKNITDAKQLTKFAADLQAASQIPLFISCDEEGGLVARLANHPAFHLPRYESAGAVGKSGNAGDAYNMGRVIGGYMVDYGFNMNFAPVADVNTNPLNPVIGSRAFSSDPVIATEMAAGMAKGLKENGIIPVYKHFPGHGDTAQDSHYGLAVSYKTKDEMAACEWLPYVDLARDTCVMTAHIAVPNVTGSDLPATMQEAVIEGVLRRQLGFEGVVMTDSMDMGAVTQVCPAGEAAVRAVLAGCDIILGPEKYQEAFDSVLEAAEMGDIPMERIDESVLRILLLKIESGLME